MASSSNAKGPALHSPGELSGRDWRAVLGRVWAGISEDDLSLVAAGCAFYALLAMVPGITALALLFGLVADPQTVQEQLASISMLMPAELHAILEEQLTNLTTASTPGLTWGLALTLSLACWYASSAVKSLMLALNIALRENETRGIIRFNLVGIAFTVLGILAIIIALGTIVGVPTALAFIGMDQATDLVVRVVRWPILFLLVVLGLAVLYRFGPSRARPRWQWITWGAVLATVIWLAASIGFSLYVTYFGNYNATYGSLGAVVIVLFWLYISMLVVLLGARLNGELEHATALDTTTGPPKPIGHRHAHFADRVARAE